MRIERAPCARQDSFPSAAFAVDADARGVVAALLLLCVTHVFNFLDRTMTFILFPLIEAETKL